VKRRRDFNLRDHIGKVKGSLSICLSDSDMSFRCKWRKNCGRDERDVKSSSLGQNMVLVVVISVLVLQGASGGV
jgi:hypothetical protein